MRRLRAIFGLAAVAAALAGGWLEFQSQSGGPVMRRHSMDRRALADRRCRGGCTGGAADAPLLNLLPGSATIAQSGQCTGTLTGVTVTRAGSKACTLSDGSGVILGNNTAHIEAQGLLLEGAATNLITSQRDLTDAAWTASNVTVAATATGWEGTATAASTLTASANNGTVLQTITTGAALRASGALIKRRTGTGTISFTHDGSAYSNVTAQLAAAPSSGWVRVCASGSAANPVVGFKIGTSGDAIDVDYVTDEAPPGATGFCTSPIVGSSRVIDLATVANPLASTNPAAWCLSARITPENTWGQPNSVRGIMGAGTFGGANGWGFYSSTATPQIRVFDNAGNFKDIVSGDTLPGTTSLTTAQITACDVSGDLSVWADGSWMHGQVDSGGTGTGVVTTQGATLKLGSFNGTSYPPWAYYRDICISGPSRASPSGTDPRSNVQNTCGQFTNQCHYGSACYLYTRQGATTIDGLGDSMTLATGIVYPFLTRLNGWLGDSYGVTNSGVAGNITSQMLTRWTGGLNVAGYSYVVVLGGVNDALNGSVAEADALANLVAIYNDAHAHNVRVLALAVLPCGNYGTCTSTPQAWIRQLNGDISSFASANPTWIRFVDTWTALGESGHPNNLAAAYSLDDLHPNQAGHDVIAAAIAQAIF